MTKFTLSTAVLAAGLMAMAAPALAQSQVTPKSGPDINQPKYVPGSSGTPSTTGAAGKEAPTNNAGGGNGSSSTGASGGAGAGAGSGSGGGGAGGGGGGGGGAGGGGGSGQ
jgi:hypothetical protein